MTDTRYICSPLHNKLLATWCTISAGNHAYTRAYEYSDMKKGGREVVEGATIRSAPKQRPFDDRLIVLGWFIQREATPRWSNSFFFSAAADHWKIHEFQTIEITFFQRLEEIFRFRRFIRVKCS